MGAARALSAAVLAAACGHAAAAAPGGLMAVPFEHPSGTRWAYADGEGRLRTRGDLSAGPVWVPAGGAEAVARGDDAGVIDDQGNWRVPLQPGGAGTRPACRDAVAFTLATGDFTGTGAVRMRAMKDHIVDPRGRPIAWELPVGHGFMGLSQGVNDCWILAHGSKADGWRYVSTRGRRMLFGGFDSLGYFSCFGQPRRCLAPARPMGQAGGLHGLIDEEGRWVVMPRWPWVGDFGDNGLARAGSDAGWVFIDGEGRTVLQPAPGQRFESGFVNGRAVASQRGLFGFIDDHGRWTAPPRFAHLGPLAANGLAVAREAGGQALGYVDAAGNWRVAPADRLAQDFSPLGLAAVRGADGCTALIDAQGRTVNAFDGSDERWQPEPCRTSRLQGRLARLGVGQPVGATALLAGASALAFGAAAWASRPAVGRALWRRALRGCAAALLPAAGVALAVGAYRFVHEGRLAPLEALTQPAGVVPAGVVLGLVSLVLATGFGLAGCAGAAVVARWRVATAKEERS